MSPPTTTADSTKDVDFVKSKSAQRKINKPLIEKRRRARINDCLAQLKAVVLGANESKSVRSSKLEKADILEMTVDFVKNRLARADVETKGTVKSSSDGETQYLAGYSKCLAEISTFLEQTRTSESSLQKEIINHVTGKIKNQLSSVCFPDNKDCESIESTSEAKPKKSNLVQIKPAVTSPNDVISNDLPVDLRTKVTDQCDTNKSATPSLYKQSKDPVLRETCSSSSQIPVAGLGGGQILLLVQLPQSVTSQVAPSLAHQQLSFTPLLNQTLSTDTKQQTLTPSSIIPGTMELETSPSGYVALPANKSLPAHAQTNSAGTSAGLEVLNLVLPSDNGENSKIGQGDHWRPW